MVFSSVLFLFLFFPSFFITYFLTVDKYKNVVILIGSTIFYIWGAPSFAPLLFISLVIDWHLVNNIYKFRNSQKIKKYLMIIALIINIGMLVYYKYTDFLLSNINFLLSFDHQIHWKEVILPIGISFIVFHKISYILDVFQGNKQPTDSMMSYFIYILLFPMSIAGPIIKYQDIQEQLAKRSTRFEDVLYGLFRFSIGLTKKLWIADNIAVVTNTFFENPSQLNIYNAWIGIVCYAIQIYFDFSGYADMAIGLSRMMGFHVPEYFNKPYTSQTITEFWRRWHISLSTWMKSYLYIPLGGNRCSKIRNYFNLWVVFLISGLWHGSSWNFIIWGAMHGTYQIIDKLFWIKISKKLPKIINIFITFVLVLIAWVFFRAETLKDAVNYLKSMFDFSSLADSLTSIPGQFFDNANTFFFILALIIIFLPVTRLYSFFIVKSKQIIDNELIQMIIIVLLLVVSIVRSVSSMYSPFIYFRF